MSMLFTPFTVMLLVLFATVCVHMVINEYFRRKREYAHDTIALIKAEIKLAGYEFQDWAMEAARRVIRTAISEAGQATDAYIRQRASEETRGRPPEN